MGVRPIGCRIHLPRTLREIALMAEELGRPRYPLPETSACITFDLDIWSPLIGSLHWPLECHGRRSRRLCLLRHFFPAWRTTGSLYRVGKSDSHQRGSVACICVRRRVRSRRYRVHVRLLSHIVDGFDTHLSRGKIADAEDFPYDIYSQPSAIVLTVRLLALSESAAHPLAEIPRFDIFLKSRFLLCCTLDAQVARDSLVILTCHDRSCELDEIHLVYWKEGQVHCVSMFSIQ